MPKKRGKITREHDDDDVVSEEPENIDHSLVTRRVEKRIVRASEIPQKHTGLIYARPKVGKTRLASTGPKPIILDVDEEGTSSTKRDIDPHVFPAKTWQDCLDFYWYLKEGNHDFKTAVIDGVTGMQLLCLNFVLGEQAALDASRDPDMPNRVAWGKVGKLMRTQITNYRNLPMNVIFTALTRTNTVGDSDSDDLDADTQIGPAVTPSVAGHLEAAVEFIGYLQKREVFVKVKKGKETKRKKVRRTRLIVDGTERYLVGDRTNSFGNFVDSPDLTEMFAAMDSNE